MSAYVLVASNGGGNRGHNSMLENGAYDDEVWVLDTTYPRGDFTVG